MLARDKHTCLLRTFVNYGRKKFYNIVDQQRSRAGVKKLLLLSKMFCNKLAYLALPIFFKTLKFKGKVKSLPLHGVTLLYGRKFQQICKIP